MTGIRKLREAGNFDLGKLVQNRTLLYQLENFLEEGVVFTHDENRRSCGFNSLPDHEHLYNIIVYLYNIVIRSVQLSDTAT